jgi:hypothetical protein
MTRSPRKKPIKKAFQREGDSFFQGRKRQLRFACVLVGVLFASRPVSAARVTERFSFGAYAASETYKSSNVESVNNDYEFLTGRAYIRAEDWGEGRWEFVSDIRDKNDFFGKLDGSKLQLVQSNDFQVRQFSLRKPNLDSRWAGQVGRFFVPEAGGVYVDGGQIEAHWSRSLKSSIFGGLSPQQLSSPYLQFNPDAQVFGANVTFEDHSLSWDRNFYLSHGAVMQNYSGHNDRTYLFHSSIYQWAVGRRIISLAFLDFVPNVVVQTGSFVWQHAINSSWNNDFNLLAVDVIGYRRIQGILETLSPSPYREASEQLSFSPDVVGKYYVKATYGQRQIDGLTKSEIDLGWSRSKIFSNKWDAYAMAGTRANFTSQDLLARIGIGYFSRSWESNLELSYGTQNFTDGTVLHPIFTEFSLSNFLSQTVYSTFSIERADDEVVTVLAAFLKIGLRMGNQEVTPIRDGAPPRGAL